MRKNPTAWPTDRGQPLSQLAPINDLGGYQRAPQEVLETGTSCSGMPGLGFHREDGSHVVRV